MQGVLDPFIVQNLFVPPPPPVASSAFERSWDYAEVARLETQIDEGLSRRAMLVDEWLGRIREIVVAAQKWSQDYRASSEDMASLDSFVDDLEQRARKFGREMERSGRKNEKHVRVGKRISTDRGAMFVRVLERGRQIDGRQLQGWIDFAWAVRAIRADVAPDRGTGPIFENGEDLRRYLASLG